MEEKIITLLTSPTVQVSKKNVSKELAQKIHDKAAPFIKWLQEAEEETSESDVDDPIIEYDERVKSSTFKEIYVQPATNGVNNVKKDDNTLLLVTNDQPKANLTSAM